jgi:hypothetical protein
VFVGLNCDNWIVIHRMENVKHDNIEGKKDDMNGEENDWLN